MVYAHSNTCPRILRDFDIQTDHLISVRRPDLVIVTTTTIIIIIIIIINIIINRTCKIVDFDVPADHRIKLRENNKKDKYLDLARELHKSWNMKVTIIPIVICAFATVTKGLLKGLEDLKIGRRMENI